MSFRVRRAEVGDLAAMLEVEQATWQEIGYTYTGDQLLDLVTTFQEGQHLVVGVGGEIVAMCNTIRTEYDPANPRPWSVMSGDGWASRVHVPGPDVFVLNLAARPEIRRGGAGTAAVIGALEYVAGTGLRAAYAVGRIPDYHMHVAEYPDVGAYIRARDPATGLARDRGVRFWERLRIRDHGWEMLGPVRAYMEDPDSVDCGVLFRWGRP